MRKFGEPKGLKNRAIVSKPHPIIARAFVPAVEKTSVTGYMCGIDWECEIGQNHHGQPIYRSVDDLKADHDCWAECGIVEVEVTIKKTIAPSQY